MYLLDGTLLNDMTNGPAGSAAGTALGMETVQEFRVETNAYSAEFGRMSGGQINVLTKAGSNQLRGSVYEFHRNDALDAKNYFDVAGKPPFTRNQFGGAVGGPIQRDRLFYFVGYEALHENLGKTITSTVPDENAHRGLIPDPAQPGALLNVGVNPGVAPYLNEYPLPNGGEPRRRHRRSTAFSSIRSSPRTSCRGASTTTWATAISCSRATRSTMRISGCRPTFRSSRGRSCRAISSSPASTGRCCRRRMLSTYRARLQPHARRADGRGQHRDAARAVRARPRVCRQHRHRRPQPLRHAELGRRAVPAAGARPAVRLDARRAAGSLFKFGAIGERYLQDMVNPTFSLGTYSFANLRAFLENRATSFIGLTPQGQFDRYWRFWLVGGYAQERIPGEPRASRSPAALRYEVMTMPRDINGRDSALPNLTDRTALTGQLYEAPDYNNVSPRVGGRVGRHRRRPHVAARRLRHLLQHQQLTEPDRHGDESAGDAARRVSRIRRSRIRRSIARPACRFVRFSGTSRRRGCRSGTSTCSASCGAARRRPIGYAGSRGTHLLRSNDVNTAAPVTGADGRPFFPAGAPRQNTAWTTIELKSSDGESWYDALIVEARRRWANGFMFQSSYTWSKSEDTTQASTFFSDATNGTTSAFPEFIPDYNKGLSDFHAAHNWVLNFSYDLPWARSPHRRSRRRPERLAPVGHRQHAQRQPAHRVRAEQPLAVAVAAVARPRHRARPSELRAGLRTRQRGHRRSRRVVQSRGVRAASPRARSATPAAAISSARTCAPSICRSSRTRRGRGSAIGGRVEVRVEVFNLFNRANFGAPQLIAFAGAADNEQPLASFGRVRNTITSARQAQFGVRVRF